MKLGVSNHQDMKSSINQSIDEGLDKLRAPLQRPYELNLYAEDIRKAVETGQWQWLRDENGDLLVDADQDEKNRAFHIEIKNEDYPVDGHSIIAKLKQQAAKSKQEKSDSRKRNEKAHGGESKGPTPFI